MKSLMFWSAVAAMLLAVANVEGAARCKKPNGNEGDVVVEDCVKSTCTALNPRKGVWLEAPST